jgi:hypothetical protein
MSKKTPAPLRIAPLQCVVAEPITDPAEQAAIDKLRKREKQKKAGPKTRRNRKDGGVDSNATAKGRG